VDCLSLEVPDKAVVSVIGANGAGKTSMLRAISGLTQLYSGEITYEGKRIDGMDPSDIVKMGVVHIPEGRMLFPYLTVSSNLKLGASLRKDKEKISEDLDLVFENFPILKSRLNQKAGTLSGGEQEMLAIGRGLMANPKLLVMDEPSLGLAPIIVHGLVPVIKNINKKGVSVLLVEQNIPLALGVAHWGYALQVGRVILEGNIEQFKENGKVKQAYLGG
jgi:branched-chain amino acid transport system ATP-binding protein